MSPLSPHQPGVLSPRPGPRGCICSSCAVWHGTGTAPGRGPGLQRLAWCPVWGREEEGRELTLRTMSGRQKSVYSCSTNKDYDN